MQRHGTIRVPSSLAYRPQPSLFSYPGLRSQAWWDPSSVASDIAPLLANVDAIREEYVRWSASSASDYVPKADEHTLHEGSWDWRSAVLKGRLQAPFQVACPITSGLLQRVPNLLAQDVPFAYAFFSTLRGGARIAPHYGPTNLRLRVHIPLVLPASPAADLGLRVAGQTRRWRRREALVFDDAYEHEAWNASGEERVVLLFDLWHPDLSQRERDAVVRLFDEARKEGWLS